MGRFGRLDAYVLDTLDVFVGKLFSARGKDFSDLRALARGVDKSQLVDRVRSSAASLLSQPQLAANATKNWFILSGEGLPS